MKLALAPKLPVEVSTGLVVVKGGSAAERVVMAVASGGKATKAVEAAERGPTVAEKGASKETEVAEEGNRIKALSAFYGLYDTW